VVAAGEGEPRLGDRLFRICMHGPPLTKAGAGTPIRVWSASSLSDSGFSINNDGCSAAPARS